MTVSMHPAYIVPSPEQRQNQRIATLENRVGAIERNPAVGPEGIAGANIAPASISTGHLAAGSVTTGALAANSITAVHIVTGTITGDKMATRTLTANEIAVGALTAVSGVFAIAAIESASIANAAIISAKIADAAITTAKIADAQITNAKIGLLAVDTAKIADAAITTAKISDAQITNAKIGLLAVDTANIANAAITTAKISDAQITTAKIADAQITTAKIGDAQITNAKIDTINGDKLIANTVLAGKLSITSLSSITANLGTINAGSISGGAITIGSGGTATTRIGTAISTSAGTKQGIVGTDASGNITFHLDSSTGAAIFKGAIQSGSTGLGNISGQVGTSQMAPGSVTGGNSGVAAIIAANTIIGTDLVTDTIGAREINVATLSAISANLGTVTAGSMTSVTFSSGTISGGTISGTTINGGIITGATIQTSTNPAAVRMNSTGFFVTNASSQDEIAITPSSGMQLRVDPGGSSVDARDIQWVSGGLTVARLQALYWAGNSSGARVFSYAPAGTPVSEIIISAEGASIASLAPTRLNLVRNNAGGASTYIDITANNISRKLLDGVGKSDFVFKSDTPTLKRCRVYRNASSSWGSNAGGAVTFTTERYDVGGFWSSGAPTRLTVPEDGIYRVTGHINGLNSGTGYVQILIRFGATTWVAEASIGQNQYGQTITTTLEMTAGQYVELHVYAGTGGYLANAGTATDWRLQEFQIEKIASLT